MKELLVSEQHLSALEVDDLEATDSPEAEQQTAAEAPQAPHDEAIDAEASGSPRRGMPRRALLEREGEVAADFLETLLDIADLDGDIDLDIDGDRAAVAIVDSDEGRVPRRLVGPGGRVLEARSECCRRSISKRRLGRSVSGS